MPVFISVKTAIEHAGIKDGFISEAKGLFYKKGNALFLQYEEVAEEGKTRTIFKMENGEALILRSGAVKMRLPFRIGEETRGNYETAYGTFLAEATTETLAQAVKASGKSGLFRLKYQLNMSGAPAGTYDLEIMFEEEIQ